MGKQFILKIFVLPIIVVMFTIVSIFITEGILEPIPPSELKLLLMLSGVVFIGCYFFVISIVLPLHVLLFKMLRQRVLAFVLFNVVGLAICFMLQKWFFTVVEFPSLYAVFPLFSILACFPVFRAPIEISK